MVVESIMTREVITIGMDETLGEVYKIFDKHKFHHLLVIEDEGLVGIISDRDVFRETSPFLFTFSGNKRDLETLKKKTHQIMTRNIISVGKDTGIEEAAGILIENNVSCLPVVSPKGKIEGILTWKDILRFYVKGDSNQAPS